MVPAKNTMIIRKIATKKPYDSLYIFRVEVHQALGVGAADQQQITGHTEHVRPPYESDLSANQQH